MRWTSGLLGILLLAGAWGCDDAPTAPTHYAPFSQIDLRVGTGSEAVTGSRLTVHYTGWLHNEDEADQKGAQFDSSLARAPFEFLLGAGQVIRGWDQGLAGMRVGGLRRLVIPPSLAYGELRNGPIPPNATLVFDIELLAVQ
ncbi:MAG TPA: FKBP-type peptidyl-prolyl cis-trans isomerase [Vicinamibacterales bacterium]|nr:FKBP-type peptidyl-prolyl cis-trans isomerase [Vicinamibacterales bacterium]